MNPKNSLFMVIFALFFKSELEPQSLLQKKNTFKILVQPSSKKK